MKSTTSSIVIKVEPIFNGNLNSFYDELYKNRITYGFIRSELGLEGLKPKTRKDKGTHPSKMYFENIKANYQKYLEQLGSKIDKKECGSMPEDTKEPHPVRPPVTQEFSIDRDEFI